MSARWPPVSPTKDIDTHPAFKSGVSRWAWKFYTQRLTKAGQWLLWPTAIFTGYGGISLANQGYVAFSYLFGIWAVAFAAFVVSRPRVRLRAMHAERICAGQVLPVDVEVENRGRLAATDWVVVPHRLPEEVDGDPAEGLPLPPVPAGETVRARLGLRCDHRGAYTLHGFRVQSDFPFGLFNAWRKFERDSALMVYPKFHRLAHMKLPAGRHLPGGMALASNPGESFEFAGDREFREGDNVRDIDWRATARLQIPIVREYREEYLLRAAVILDTHVPKKGRKLRRGDFERAVSVAAAVSDHMARQEYLVDLFAAGPDLYHLTAGRSAAYLDPILDILACVKESAKEPFDAIEPELMEHLSKITTVICVLLDWDETRRDFVDRLSRSGAGVKVVVVRDAEPTLTPETDGRRVADVPVVSKAECDAGVEAL